MTAADVIAQARVDVKDDVAPFRVRDAVFVGWVDRAVRDAARLSPWILCVNGISLPPHAVINSTTAVVAVTTDSLPGLVAYVAARWLERMGLHGEASAKQREFYQAFAPLVR